MTPEEDFKQRLVAVLQDLQTHGKNDSEVMGLIGSLATALVDKARAPTWRSLKQGLTREAYDGLLRDFESQERIFRREGKAKQAYAVQVLALSTIAKTQLDPQMQIGAGLLDDLIEQAVKLWREYRASAV